MVHVLFIVRVSFIRAQTVLLKTRFANVDVSASGMETSLFTEHAYRLPCFCGSPSSSASVGVSPVDMAPTV